MASSPIQPSLFEFLDDLSRNNNREWFAANKQRYESQVRDAAVAWIAQWVKPLAKVAPMLSVIPSAHRGSLMRIYRDTRFSKDKTPYKANVGISLRHQADGDIHAPGVYVHLACDESFVGVGSWRPPREALAAYRQAIDEDPKVWKRARDDRKFRAVYELGGDRLKSSPRDYPADHPMIEDLRRIDFVGMSPLTQSDVTAADSAALIIERTKAAKPFLSFLCGSLGIPY